jgi:hypothetical protein
VRWCLAFISTGLKLTLYRAGVVAHGALRVPDDLFLDPVNDSGSFLPSFSLTPLPVGGV